MEEVESVVPEFGDVRFREDDEVVNGAPTFDPLGAGRFLEFVGGVESITIPSDALDVLCKGKSRGSGVVAVKVVPPAGGRACGGSEVRRWRDGTQVVRRRRVGGGCVVGFKQRLQGGRLRVTAASGGAIVHLPGGRMRSTGAAGG